MGDTFRVVLSGLRCVSEDKNGAGSMSCHVGLKVHRVQGDQYSLPRSSRFPREKISACFVETARVKAAKVVPDR